MKTEKQKVRKRNIMILFSIASLLFTHSPSIASTKKRSENQGQVSASVNIEKTGSTSQPESGNQKYKKTTVLKWDPERNCWEPWRCDKTSKNSKKQITEKAYTRIKVWNCEIDNWEPYQQN